MLCSHFYITWVFVGIKVSCICADYFSNGDAWRRILDVSICNPGALSVLTVNCFLLHMSLFSLFYVNDFRWYEMNFKQKQTKHPSKSLFIRVLQQRWTSLVLRLFFTLYCCEVSDVFTEYLQSRVKKKTYVPFSQI